MFESSIRGMSARAGFVSAAAALVLGIVSAGASAAGAGIAMVSDVDGACRLMRGDTTAPCAILDYLGAGDTLEVDASVNLAVVYLASGREHRFTGPAQLRIDAAAPAVLSGEVGRERAMDLIGESGLAPSEQPFLAQAALVVRGDGATLELESPLNSTIVEPAPVFRWSPIAEGTRYRFVLASESGEVLADETTTRTALPLPGGVTLAPGGFYEWQVLAKKTDGRVLEASADFQLAPPTVAARVERLRPAADSPVSDRVVFATLMDQMGLRHEATRVWRTVARDRPGDPNMARLLGR